MLGSLCACLSLFNVDGAKIQHETSFFQISSPKSGLFGNSLKPTHGKVSVLPAMVPKHDVRFKGSLKEANRQFKGTKLSD